MLKKYVISIIWDTLKDNMTFEVWIERKNWVGNDLWGK
jgi:hypothetical protein